MRRFGHLVLALVASGLAFAGTGAKNRNEVTRAIEHDAVPDSAELYYISGHHSDVVRLLGRQKELRPRGLLLLGWSLYRLDRLPESAAAFESGLAKSPENLDLINGLAFAHYRLGNAAAAEAGFRRVLEGYPEREESIRGLAGVLYTSQRFEECLPIFDRLLQQHPEDGDVEHRLVKSVDGQLSAWRGLGRTPAEMVAEAWRKAADGQPRSAFEMFQWVLGVDAFHPGARLGVGTLGPRFGREADARRCLEELLREDPADARARAALARLHLEAGRTREADAEVSQLLARSPRDPQGLALQREMRSRAGGGR